ncbi:MAG: hypothetical protein SNJ63_04795 [Sphingomonadaceae bacterium]
MAGGARRQCAALAAETPEARPACREADRTDDAGFARAVFLQLASSGLGGSAAGRVGRAAGGGGWGDAHA